MTHLINWKRATPISIQRRNNPLLSLQNELDKAMSDLGNMFEIPYSPLGNFENLAITPSVDIVDDKENFKVEAEMPGIDENDIKVSIGDGLLTIKGEKTVSSKNEGKNYLMREIGYGSYERSIPLPDSVDTDKAKASFKKGMLWVQIPKKAESVRKSRDLPIEKVSK